MAFSLPASQFQPIVDAISRTLTLRLEQLLVSYVGPRAEAPVVGYATGADLMAGAIYTLAAAAVIAAAALAVRGKARRHRLEQPGAIKHHLLLAMGRPLYILIVLLGVYCAVTPLLLHAPAASDLSALYRLLDDCLEAGAIGALTWFLIRITRMAETRLIASSGASGMALLLIPLAATGARMLAMLVGASLCIPLLEIPKRYSLLLERLTTIALIAAIAVFLARAVSMARGTILGRLDFTAADNLRARKISTQVNVASRALYVLITMLSMAAVLMMFQEVRHIGTSLLASAGIVGIVAGIAAQKPLANLFAGFQIALTQPVREDDVVLVEGEWGRVEEITLSYVVVHIWDDRRLIMPLSYFIEKPFQNWTRTSAAIMGSVMVWVDYSFPVEEGRRALKGIVESSALWDKRFWNLQVSDADDKAIQLRVLATAANSSASWDLRCEIREKFIAYIQSRHPGCLPRVRAEIIGAAERAFDAPAPHPVRERLKAP